MDERKNKLITLFDNFPDKDLILNVIDEVIFLEEQLNYLKTLPMIRVNPKDSSQSKMTESSKLYQKFLQQYNNDIKILISYSKNQDMSEDENDAFAQLNKWSNQK